MELTTLQAAIQERDKLEKDQKDLAKKQFDLKAKIKVLDNFIKKVQDVSK